MPFSSKLPWPTSRPPSSTRSGSKPTAAYDKIRAIVGAEKAKEMFEALGGGAPKTEEPAAKAHRQEEPTARTLLLGEHTAQKQAPPPRPTRRPWPP